MRKYILMLILYLYKVKFENALQSISHSDELEKYLVSLQLYK